MHWTQTAQADALVLCHILNPGFLYTAPQHREGEGENSGEPPNRYGSKKPKSTGQRIVDVRRGQQDEEIVHTFGSGLLREGLVCGFLGGFFRAGRWWFFWLLVLGGLFVWSGFFCI